jgi:hypothetical protein
MWGGQGCMASCASESFSGRFLVTAHDPRGKPECCLCTGTAPDARTCLPLEERPMPEPLPPAIVANVARAVRIIRAWNAGSIVPRDTSANPRRRRARVERALQTLAILETQAQALGIPLETVGAPWDEQPVVDPDAGAVPERCPVPPREPHTTLPPPGAATPPPTTACG